MVYEGMMRIQKWAAVVLAGTFVSCASLKTTAGWDDQVDFLRYKTWDWKDDGSIKDPVWNRRVQSVLEDQLAKRGMTRSATAPDLWVVVHARVTAETRVDSYSPAWGYGYGYWAAPTLTEVYQIPVGSMIVDLVDPKKKELVWRATASDTIRANKENEEREQRLIEVLDEMFAGYPPTPRPAAATGAPPKP